MNVLVSELRTAELERDELKCLLQGIQSDIHVNIVQAIEVGRQESASKLDQLYILLEEIRDMIEKKK